MKWVFNGVEYDCADVQDIISAFTTAIADERRITRPAGFKLVVERTE